MAWKIKQNDTRPSYIATLQDKFGTPEVGPIDLNAATTVRFLMRPEGATDPAAPKVDGVCAIDDADAGIVSYTWVAGDLDEVGVYNVEFEIHWNDGGIETVPNDGYNKIEVVDDLGGS